jgi:hypothetical protein
MPPPPVQTMETSSELMIAPAEPSRVNVRPPTTKIFPVSAWKTPPPTRGRPVVDRTSFTPTFQSGVVSVAGPGAMDGAASWHGEVGDGDLVGLAVGFPDGRVASHTTAATRRSVTAMGAIRESLLIADKIRRVVLGGSPNQIR